MTIKNRFKFPATLLALSSLAAVPTASAATTIFAEYHLGEAGSLSVTTNIPQDSSGNGRHFSNDISGATTSVGTVGVSAPGSTEYLDVSGAGNEGWHGADFSTLPTDDFAVGVYARAASIAAGAGGVITTAGGDGGFKIGLEANGWGASAHNVAWIGTAGGEAGSFTADTWVHLALIRSGGVTEFYIDGVGQGAAYGGAPVVGSAHLTVDPGGSVYFDGQIDEARLVTFTTGESAANVLAVLQGVPEPSVSLLGGLGLLVLLRRRR